MRCAIASLAVLVLGLGLVARPAAAQELVLLGSHVFKMNDDTTPPIYASKKKFNWRVRSGTAPVENRVVIPDAGSDGDPTIHGATFTVYNAAGSGEVWTTDLPAEKWVRTGRPASGYRYVYVSPPPVVKIWIKDNKITFRGGNAPWGYSLDEPAQGTLAVRLTLGTGVTWCTSVDAYAPGTPPNSEKFDRVDLFRGERFSPPPVACPPVPTP